MSVPWQSVELVLQMLSEQETCRPWGCSVSPEVRAPSQGVGGAELSQRQPYHKLQDRDEEPAVQDGHRSAI